MLRSVIVWRLCWLSLTNQSRTLNLAIHRFMYIMAHAYDSMLTRASLDHDDTSLPTNQISTSSTFFLFLSVISLCECQGISHATSQGVRRCERLQSLRQACQGRHSGFSPRWLYSPWQWYSRSTRPADRANLWRSCLFFLATYCTL